MISHRIFFQLYSIFILEQKYTHTCDFVFSLNISNRIRAFEIGFCYVTSLIFHSFSFNLLAQCKIYHLNFQSKCLVREQLLIVGYQKLDVLVLFQRVFVSFRFSAPLIVQYVLCVCFHFVCAKMVRPLN